MEQSKSDASQVKTAQEVATPPSNYVKPIDPHGTEPRFLNKKYASAIIFVVCLGIIAFAFTLGTGII